MKKIILSIALVTFATQLWGQVGIGTNTPNASSMLEVKSTDKGILFPRMSSTQRNAITAPAVGLYVFDTNTNSLWYYNGSLWINTVSEANYGDVKSGFQNSDHSGWIKLDGRAVTSLNSTQRAVAISLGFTSNLPDATSAYLVQETTGLGTVSGTNTTTLTQANLPNVNFTGTAANAGGHLHTTDPAAFNSTSAGSHNHTTDPVAFYSATAGNHDHWIDPPSQNTSSNGAHNHTSYYADPNNASGGNGGVAGGVWFGATGIATSTNGVHQHSVDIPGFNSSWNGDHSHSIDVPSTTSSTEPNHLHSIDVPSTTSSAAPDHSHTVSVASGGSATPIDISPKSLIVNMFVYLGQ